MARRIKYSIATLAYLAAIYYLSSISGGRLRPNLFRQLIWNLGHIPLYAGLTLLFFLVLSGGNIRTGLTRASFWMAPFVAVAWGIFDEWHQSFVPGRYGSVGDLFLDISGIMLATMLFWRFSQVRKNSRIYV